jgi:hypothetical protein
MANDSAHRHGHVRQWEVEYAETAGKINWLSSSQNQEARSSEYRSHGQETLSPARQVESCERMGAQIVTSNRLRNRAMIRARAVWKIL